MVFYFDEAGNSGCLTKSGEVSYRRDDQPLYVLAAIMPGYRDSGLMDRYREFKARWRPEGGEVKGSDLLTRRSNDALEDFIERFVGKCPVWPCVYSKDFYLATALMQSALGPARSRSSRSSITARRQTSPCSGGRPSTRTPNTRTARQRRLRKSSLGTFSMEVLFEKRASSGHIWSK